MKKIIFLFLGMSIFLFSQDNSELKKQAYKYIQSGRYGEAIEILNKYITSNPQDASAYDMRGKCYENRSQYEEALEDYKRASKLEPGNNNYKNNVIRIRKNWDDIILKRIEGYKRELFRNPKNYDNYLKIAKCYQDLENYNEAEKWFDDYMSKKELSANDAILYANMLIKANKLKKAESIITAQINKYPQDHRLLSKRGWIRNWLGDYKNAINDFERALVIKPFFKEAQDGLDNAKGKGYNFTIVEKDTGKARFEFAIDKYTRILQKYPNKDDIRFLLIEELLKYKRIGEAQVHLAYLADKYSENEKYKELFEKYEALRDTTFNQQLRTLQAKIQKDPKNRKYILEIIKFYGNQQMYNNAVNIGMNYLKEDYDEQIAYYTALYASYNLNYDTALKILSELTNKQPNNFNYTILYCKICVWTNQNLEDASYKLKIILKKEPKNFEALKTYALLNVLIKNYNTADSILRVASKLDYDNYELRKLFYVVVKNRNESNIINDYHTVQNLNLQDNELYTDNEKTLVLLNQKYKNDEYFYYKLADFYLNNDEIEKYNEVIDNLLLLNNNPDISKNRIQNLIWKKKYNAALSYIQKHEKEYSADAQINLMKLQCYSELKNYKNAKNITDFYNTRFPNNYIFNLNASWFPGEYYTAFKFSTGKFPLFFNVLPEIFTFSDNQYFQYQYQGIRFEAGISSILSATLSIYQGKFSSTEPINTYSNKFTNAKIGLLFKLPANWNTALYFSNVSFGDRTSKPITELNINKLTSEYYVSTTIMSTDARFLVYSPKILFYKLNTNYLNFNGYYKIREDAKLSLSTSLLLIDGPVYSYKITETVDPLTQNVIRYTDTIKYKKNGGNDFKLRLGKDFYENLHIGYEYYLVKYVNTIAEYYSPKNFETHGVFAEWLAYKDKEIELKMNGKVGYVFSTDFIIKEFQLVGSYKFNYNLSLNLNVNFGSSARYETAYSSRMFNLYLMWSI